MDRLHPDPFCVGWLVALVGLRPSAFFPCSRRVVPYVYAASLPHRTRHAKPNLAERITLLKRAPPSNATAIPPFAITFETQDPETGDPMEHFRNTPVEKKQVVRTYERFSQIVSHLLQPNGRVLVISEWGGRSVKASFHVNLVGLPYRAVA